MAKASLLARSRRDRVLVKLLIRVFPNPIRLLEAGSNTGHLSLILGSLGYSITLLDILEKPIQQAREKFAKGNVQASFLVQDIQNTAGDWEGVWNSGVIQCYAGEARENLIEHVCRLGKRVLFIYPDTEQTGRIASYDTAVPPGISGSHEYPVQDIPLTISKYCRNVHHGVLAKDLLRLPHDFHYVWGDSVFS